MHIMALAMIYDDSTFLNEKPRKRKEKVGLEIVIAL
jgi:hypothetical protein